MGTRPVPIFVFGFKGANHKRVAAQTASIAPPAAWTLADAPMQTGRKGGRRK
jgi:hypothetical protein